MCSPAAACVLKELFWKESSSSSAVCSMLIACRVASQEFARARDHLTHFLTYADNNAVGYFAKQGFTKEITLEKDRVSQQQP